jgi:hypothetical protein
MSYHLTEANLINPIEEIPLVAATEAVAKSDFLSILQRTRSFFAPASYKPTVARADRYIYNDKF